MSDQPEKQSDEKNKAGATKKRREALAKNVRKDVQLFEKIIHSKDAKKKAQARKY